MTNQTNHNKIALVLALVVLAVVAYCITPRQTTTPKPDNCDKGYRAYIDYINHHTTLEEYVALQNEYNVTLTYTEEGGIACKQW